MAKRPTQWVEEMLGDGFERARGTFLRRASRPGSSDSDEPVDQADSGAREPVSDAADAAALDEATQTGAPGKERGAADQQRTDDGHGYAGQGAPGQPGTS